MSSESAYPETDKKSGCGHVPKKHSLFMGVVVCSKTIQSVRRFRRSYELQVVLFVLLTAALPNLVGHLHSKGETRNKDNFLQPVWELVLTYIPSMASHFMFGSDMTLRSRKTGGQPCTICTNPEFYP
eukprot:661648-Amorphochlora_amoeboformis.AAC.2